LKPEKRLKTNGGGKDGGAFLHSTLTGINGVARLRMPPNQTFAALFFLLWLP